MTAEYGILNTENGHVAAITFPSLKAATKEIGELVRSHPGFEGFLQAVRMKR